jgi:ATP-dependent DNA helicase RecG
MALRREMPAVRVDYIRVTGTEWLPDPHNRFESIDMRGPLLLMVNRAFNAIADDLPRGFSLKPGNLQANRPLSIPEEALREAIVNSLIHQNFRIHQPIQIIRYSNRIEIINPGFSLKPAETLGEPGSRLRNPTISSIFHETQLAEAKGTGIGTMRRLMKEASMVPPTFESDHGRNTFTARILLHHFLSENDLAWFTAIKADKLSEAQKVALIFVREVGAIDNITYRQLSGTSAKDANKELKMLVSLEFIKPKGQGRQTYYIPTESFKSLFANGATSSANGATSSANGATSSANGATSDAKYKGTLDGVPNPLRVRINNLGRRVSKKTLSSIIVDLCRIQPRSREELANILGKTETHIKNNLLPELLKSRLIQFTFPEMKNHPNQKYTATK